MPKAASSSRRTSQFPARRSRPALAIGNSSPPPTRAVTTRSPRRLRAIVPLKCACSASTPPARNRVARKPLRSILRCNCKNRRRFLQLQRKIDLSGFRATRFLAGRLEAEHAHFNGTIARRRRGERVVTALVGGGDEFPIANAGRDRRAGNWLVRRLDEAALGIQPSAGGQQRKEKKTMLR